jgi:hypothetical protein
MYKLNNPNEAEVQEYTDWLNAQYTRLEELSKGAASWKGVQYLGETVSSMRLIGKSLAIGFATFPHKSYRRTTRRTRRYRSYEPGTLN